MQSPGLWVCEPEDLQGSPYWALTRAVHAGDVSRVRELLALGVPLRPTRPVPSSLNPLAVEAVLAGQRDVLESLLDAEPHAVAAVDWERGGGLLHWAAWRGDWGAAHLLLSRRADVSQPDREGLLPVHAAAMQGQRAILELLLGAGSPVDAAAAEVGTPLALAAARGHAHCVECLLARGGAVEVVDARGRTPLLLAAAEGHARVVRALLRAGASPAAADDVGRRTALHWLAHHGHVDAAEELMQAQGGTIDVNVQDADSETPLLLASRRGFEPLVDLLLRHGAAVDAASRHGVTPLMAAALFGHAAAAARLLGSAASVAAADAASARTPLHYAALGGEPAVVEALLRGGAEQAAADRGGLTPRDLAREAGVAQVLHLLR